MAHLNAPQFQTEEAARIYLEALRWPLGRTCPHCGTVGNSYETSRIGKYRCGSKECRKDFTVTVGTVYERSHIPLHKWLLASYLLCSSKKGISSHQLHRMLGVTYKSAWFMTHRIREAFKPGAGLPPLGGEGKTVEADETYVGGLEKNKHRSKRKHLGTGGTGKEAVFALVERGGKVRSTHVQKVTGEMLRPIMQEQLHASTRLMTDEAGQYKHMHKHFASHEVVAHSLGEYVRGGVHTNTIEGYFSVFKRGMKGVYQHCSAEHLKRYLAEFDFRYNERQLTDAERTVIALKGIEGKRLMYRHTVQ